MEKLLIIDANSLINRAFYGVRYLSAPDGTPTNAIYGFLMMLLKLAGEHKPDYTVAAFDLKAPTFRHKMYDGYKAQRKPMPEELAVQMPIVKQILDAMHVMRIEKEGFEADDIIGTVSRICGTRKIKCLIATGDKDDLQLADAYTSILLTTTRNGSTDTEEYTPAEVFARYGVTPTEFIDVKALMGDASDNIPGVAGIGEKTAMSLIARFKSIDNIYADFESHGFSASQAKKLAEGKESAYLSKTLATIDTAVPIELDFEAARCGVSATGEVYNLMMKLGLNSIIKRMDFSEAENMNTEAYNPTESCTRTVISDIAALEKLCEDIKNAKEVSLVFSINGGDVTAIGAAVGENGYSVEMRLLGSEAVFEKMGGILADEKIRKLCFNAKEAIVALAPRLRLRGIAYDLAIAAYLINPSRPEYTINALAIEYFGISPVSKSENRQLSIFDDTEEADESIIDEALLIRPLYERTLEKLRAAEQEKLYFEIELPLVTVLADMQLEGMYIDRERLAAFGEMLGEKIAALTEEIYEMAGGEFNINSPKQLGEVLFARLQLQPARKTKKGYSTGAEVLEVLRDKHPIIDAILEYRRAAKLKSTYCDGLAAVISPDGKIHSVFNQTVTATGRISSAEPNMQNIPTRTELGRELRKMFAAEGGRIFVDADYSQIELRVLASIADDKAMRKAFSEGTDIHTETAAQVLKISAGEVTREQRSRAKAVNFGIVYGMSDFSLAQDLKIPVKEARTYIDSYLAHYSGVRDYMQKIKTEAKENGYVKTLMNRVRYIPELKSANYATRMFGERVALNTPIQGTAADIIKLAMVRVHKRLAEEELDARLVLQVHDELIVECSPEAEEAVRRILRKEMENAVQIGVPLAVDMASGRSWYDCK